MLPTKNWSDISPGEWTPPSVPHEAISDAIPEVDYWRFSTDGATLDVNITPTVQYNNLHLIASLYDHHGNLLIEGTPLDTGHTIAQASRFRVELLAGDYFIEVRPSGAPDNDQGEGYPVYGSVGYYQFHGKLK